MNPVIVKDAIVLVTGGQRGIGLAFAHELLARGARKVYVTSRSPSATHDPRLVPLPLDVTNAVSVRALARQTEDASIVVSTVGIAGEGPLLQMPEGAVSSLFDTNVFGSLRIAKAFAPILADNGGGALIEILSPVTWAPESGVYGATKAALWSLTNSLRLDLSAQNTLVVGVHVGSVATDLTQKVPMAKLPSEAVAIAVLDGMEAGHVEILVDEMNPALRKSVSNPITAPASIVSGSATR